MMKGKIEDYSYLNERNTRGNIYITVLARFFILQRSGAPGKGGEGEVSDASASKYHLIDSGSLAGVLTRRDDACRLGNLLFSEVTGASTSAKATLKRLRPVTLEPGPASSATAFASGTGNSALFSGATSAMESPAGRRDPPRTRSALSVRKLMRRFGGAPRNDIPTAWNYDISVNTHTIRTPSPHSTELEKLEAYVVKKKAAQRAPHNSRARLSV